MKHFHWDQIQEEYLNPLLSRKVIHGERLTVARIYLKRYAVIPTHSHEHEQITTVERGSLKFTFDIEERVLKPGDVLDIPPHVAHKVEALEDSVAVDLFSPVRQDWVRGEDAYLRTPQKL